MKNAIKRLNAEILKKNSRICAGLDPTWENIPKCVKEEVYSELMQYEEMFPDEGVELCKESEATSHNEDSDFSYAFMTAVFKRYCQKYIDAVADIVPAIKINSAFFEEVGLEDLYLSIATYAKSKELFVIGDLKRADIGSTSLAYAKAYLNAKSPFDAITVNPYFGIDGIEPFLKLGHENHKGIFVLVKTSNKSSSEIQDLELKDGRKVYEAVADLVVEWGRKVDSKDYFENIIPDYPMIGAVVGATHPEQAKDLVSRMGNIFCLVPGYGAQGATADDVAAIFDNEGLGAIVNSSRGIMNAYKSDRWKDQYCERLWEKAATAEAKRATDEINAAINEYLGKSVC